MREKQIQREAAMDKEELVFTTIEDLIRYLGEYGEDVQIHMEIEVEGKRRAPDAAEEGDSQIPLTSPEGAAAVMRDVLKELDREWVCVVNMDNHLKPVNFNIVSIGSINQSLAPIQNIFDFSGVKIEPLFENQVDFETFSKSDFKRHPRLLRAGRADRKDADCNHEPAAAAHDGH